MNSSRSWESLCYRDYLRADAPNLLHSTTEFFGTIPNPGVYPDLPKFMRGPKFSATN